MKTLGLAFLALCFSAGIAHACADGLLCAVVKPAPDGFVALRADNTVRSRLVTRLAPFEILVVLYSDCRPNRMTDSWTKVECVPRLDGTCKQNSRTTTGWVSSAYIVTAACPEDLNQ